MQETKPRLLAAASRVALRDGAAHLTLDAVAREAGASKGGVLYHFPTKEQLITAMLTDLAERFDQELAAALTGSGDGSGRWLRAYIAACFAPAATAADVRAALLAAIAANPDLLTPIQDRFQIWQTHAEADGLDPALATVIRLAADGLWFAELFGLAPPGGESRQRVMATLLQLAAGQP